MAKPYNQSPSKELVRRQAETGNSDRDSWPLRNSQHSDLSGAVQAQLPDEKESLLSAEALRKDSGSLDAVLRAHGIIGYLLSKEQLENSETQHLVNVMGEVVNAAELMALEPSSDLPTYRRFLGYVESLVRHFELRKTDIRERRLVKAYDTVQQIEENLLQLNKHICTIQEKIESERKSPLHRDLPSHPTQLESEARILGARLRDLPREDRARIVDQFLAEAKYAPALSFLLDSVPSLPARPPEKWVVPSKGRRPAHVNVEKVTDFIKRVYRDWYGRGLTRQHLTKIDPDLSTSLRNWERLHPEDTLRDLPKNKNEFLVSWFRENLSEDQLRDVANALFTRVLRGPESTGPK